MAAVVVCRKLYYNKSVAPGRIFVFSLTGAAKKPLFDESPLIERGLGSAGVVLAGIERSPKIFDF
jgi:hypothetical protein